MKKSKSLSFLALLLSFLLLSACTGTGKSVSTDPSPASDSPSVSDSAEELTPSEEVITLTAFRDFPEQPSNWSWGDDPTSQWITEKTGIRVEVTCAGDSSGTQLTTMLASGQELPDFIISDPKGPSRRLLISQGFVHPLNKLADEYYPEFWEVLPTEMDKIYQNDDDTLTFLPRTQSYRSMLEQLNLLYREGIINAEMYTHAPNSEQQRGVLMERNFYAYCGYYWTMINNMGLPQEEEYFTIDFPLPEGTDRSKFHVYNDFLSIGTAAVYITVDTEYPKDCIRYLTFMLSDEGQYAQRYGTEGLTFEFDQDGVPKYTPLKDEIEAKGFDILQREYGVHNYNFSWLTQNWVAMVGAKYTYPYVGIMNHFKLVTPYMKSNRLADMTWALTSEEGMLLKEQTLNLWRSMVPQIVTAEDDITFEATYKKFMEDLDVIGVSKLEEMLSENRLKWIARGISGE